MKKFYLGLLSCLFALALVGCGSNKGGLDGQQEQLTPSSQKSTDSQSRPANDVVIDTDRKVTYTVSYSITDENVAQIKSSITAKNTEFGGYVNSSSETGDNRSSFVYKVPTDKLNSFLDYIDTFESVDSKEVSSEDITSTYNYTQARIEVLQASRNAYVRMLTDTSSLKTSDIITINDKISDIDTELAAINYTMASYENSLAYSTVKITYYKTYVYQGPSFFREYLEYLGDFFVGLGEGILYALPVLLVIAGLFAAIFFPVRATLRKKTNKKKD